RHQKEFEPEPLFLITSGKKLVQFFPLVNLRFLLNEAGPIIFAYEITNFLCLQECHRHFKFVVHATSRLPFFIPQEGNKFQKVFAFDVLDVNLVATLLEILESRSVGGNPLEIVGDYFLAEEEQCKSANLEKAIWKSLLSD